MKEYTSRTLVSGLLLPEGPRWHEGRLWFSDIHGHTVSAVDPRGKMETIVQLGNDRPSGLGYLSDGSLLIVLQYSRRLVRWRGGSLATVADLSSMIDGSANDMVVDGRDRAYIGSFNTRDHSQDNLVVLVTPDGKARVAADGLGGPNGMVITPDGKTLIAAETRERRLTAFDIAADGSLSNQRLWAQMENGRSVDGVCLDAEGAVWVGSPRTKECLRVREGGTISGRLHYADRSPLACMLGGPDRRTLFVLTACFVVEEILALETPADDHRSPSLGWIETTQVEVPGTGLP